MGRRRNGCAQPFTTEQLCGWIIQPIVLVCYALVAFGFLSDAALIVTACLWSVFLAAGLSCWLFCQLIDPSVNIERHCPIPRKEHESHYCAVCKKVPFAFTNKTNKKRARWF